MAQGICHLPVIPDDRILIPGQFTRDLWWTEWQWDRILSQYFGFFPRQYHSTCAPYSLIHPPPTLWNSIILQRFKKLSFAMIYFSSVVTMTNLSFRQRTALRLPKEQRFSCLQCFQPDRGYLVLSNTEDVSVKWPGPKADHSFLPNTECAGSFLRSPIRTWKHVTPVSLYLFSLNHQISPKTKFGFDGGGIEIGEGQTLENV
jgi:hypothetical protein